MEGIAVALQAVISLVFSLRALYGTDELRNGLHGSLSISSAEKEIRFIFPEGKMVQLVHCQSWGDGALACPALTPDTTDLGELGFVCFTGLWVSLCIN